MSDRGPADEERRDPAKPSSAATHRTVESYTEARQRQTGGHVHIHNTLTVPFSGCSVSPMLPSGVVLS